MECSSASRPAMFDNFLKNLRLKLVQCATNWQEHSLNKNDFPTLCLAPFKLLPQWSVSPWRGCGRRRCRSQPRRCPLDFFSVSRKGRTCQKNLFQSYRICLKLSPFLNRLRLDFYLCFSTTACSALVSSFLVASVTFTSAEYCTWTDDFPAPVDVFPRNTGDLVDIFTGNASGL